MSFYRCRCIVAMVCVLLVSCAGPVVEQDVTESKTQNPSERAEHAEHRRDGITPAGGSTARVDLPVIEEMTIRSVAPLLARCGLITVCVTARDPNSGPFIEFSWKQVAGPQTFAGPFVSNAWAALDEGATTELDASRSSCIQFQPASPGIHTFELTLFDQSWSEDVYKWVRTEDILAAQGQTDVMARVVQKIPVHVTAALDQGNTLNPQRFEVIQAGNLIGEVSPVAVKASAVEEYYIYRTALSAPPYFCPDGDPLTVFDQLHMDSYNGNLCFADAPVPVPSQATLALLRTTECSIDFALCRLNRAKLSVILNAPSGITGGAAALTVAGLETDPFAQRRFNIIDDTGPFAPNEDQSTYDAQTQSAAFAWDWTAAETDGMAIDGISWQQCVTVTPHFEAGISSWVVHAGDNTTPPVTLDMSQPVEVCPIQCRDYVDLPGDADRNGSVDGTDFLIWQRHTGLSHGATWEQADFDGDGDVDDDDVSVWQAHYGR